MTCVPLARCWWEVPTNRSPMLCGKTLHFGKILSLLLAGKLKENVMDCVQPISQACWGRHQRRYASIFITEIRGWIGNTIPYLGNHFEECCSQNQSLQWRPNVLPSSNMHVSSNTVKKLFSVHDLIAAVDHNNYPAFRLDGKFAQKPFKVYKFISRTYQQAQISASTFAQHLDERQFWISCDLYTHFLLQETT